MPNSRANLLHTGRVVVVSGGVRGIGRALCEGFLAAGAHVIAFHRGEHEESRAAEAAFLSGAEEAVDSGDLRIVRADVTRADDRARVLELALHVHGRLDVLVNNAGVCYRDDLTPDRVREQETINALAPLEFSREAAAIMRENGHASQDTPTRGCILGISSYVTEWADLPSEYIRHYANSKRALELGMKDLALQLRGDDINVNVIAVGVVYAGMGLATIGRKEEALRNGELPVTKFASVDSVVFEALCLAHPSAHYKTGRIEVLDGGWNLGGVLGS